MNLTSIIYVILTKIRKKSVFSVITMYLSNNKGMYFISCSNTTLPLSEINIHSGEIWVYLFNMSFNKVNEN